MNWMNALVEEKIQEAIRNGEFDHLPGTGKPLVLDDDSMVPEELRVSYRVMKNAGMLPEEMQLRKDMLTLADLLACCRDEEERKKLNRKLSEKKIRYHVLMSERGWQHSGVFEEYEVKIQESLTRPDESNEDSHFPGKRKV